LLITSSVSLIYSSSVAANAAGVTCARNVVVMMVAVVERI
jgi:hypothetical protein